MLKTNILVEVPVNAQIKILVPNGKQVKSLHLMRSDRRVDFTLRGGYAVLNIPNLHIA